MVGGSVVGGSVIGWLVVGGSVVGVFDKTHFYDMMAASEKSI